MNSWEEEFEERFLLQSGYFRTSMGYRKVRDYVRTLLEHQRKEIVEKIRELKLSSMSQESPAPYYHVGYEKALDEAIKVIESEVKE